MKTFECIRSRRSVRKFSGKEVPDDIIKKLIDAARNAPFGGPLIKDCQLWEFIIIKKQYIKTKLALNYDDRQFIKEAPVIIAACADKSKDSKYKDWEITTSFAIENILLAAHDLGLGACYVTAFTHHAKHEEDKELLSKTLNLPKNIELIGLIPIGYPDASEKIKTKELRETNELIHLDKW